MVEDFKKFEHRFESVWNSICGSCGIALVGLVIVLFPLSILGFFFENCWVAMLVLIWASFPCVVLLILSVSLLSKYEKARIARSKKMEESS